ncbi:hypothetical protein B0J12DRAFT_412912 [Macrophomina phaseolina]|uniref:Uncharacterized protein n=1 Tax=Macrophomina phaseolina TaxID=35725 RepID=A0ABQ8GJD6_9PEZI|nr:hypothetical protein B0J12DRAFT_412912 [Macrophomina phaseolina]
MHCRRGLSRRVSLRCRELRAHTRDTKRGSAPPDFSTNRLHTKPTALHGAPHEIKFLALAVLPPVVHRSFDIRPPLLPPAAPLPQPGRSWISRARRRRFSFSRQSRHIPAVRFPGAGGKCHGSSCAQSGWSAQRSKWWLRWPHSYNLQRQAQPSRYCLLLLLRRRRRSRFLLLRCREGPMPIFADRRSTMRIALATGAGHTPPWRHGARDERYIPRQTTPT